MKQRTFKRLVAIGFWIGVNVIGLPVLHLHKGALYAVGRHTTLREPKWFGNKTRKLCS